MSELIVENMNTVPMTVEDNSNVEMSDPSEERIIQAISPDVEMERVDGGLKITITDKDGVHESTVYDGPEGPQGPEGQEGQAGADGQDGQDGYSPVATVTKSGDTATISITDANGTTTAQITDGQDGSDGADGQDAYVYIRYADNQPTQDSDMKTTPSDWIGIYSGDASTAPTAYTSYTWYKIKGEQGTSGVQYASELPMSSSDSTKTDVAINGKVAIQQDVLDAGKALGIGLDGRVTPVPFSGDDFTGATASSDGVHGYVPAPLTGEQGKVLMGDGTWSDDIPNRLADVENVYTDTDVTIASTDWTLSSGSYVYTWTSALVTASCGIEVFLRDGAESAGIEDFDASKVSGGVQFTTDEQPTGSLPVTIRIINTKSDQLVSLSADEVSSEAITGCNDVETALGNLDGRVTTLNSKIDTITTYTTTEVEIGVWKDGKKLYRNWAQYENVNENTEVLVSAVSGAAVKNFWGVVYSDNNSAICLPINYDNQAGSYTKCYYDRTNYRFPYKSNGYGKTHVYIVYEYTK